METNGKLNDGLATGFILLFESSIFPFMLSSAFTARTIVQEKDEVDSVQTDVWIAVGFSILMSLIMGYFFKSPLASGIGIATGIAIALTYEIRGELI